MVGRIRAEFVLRGGPWEGEVLPVVVEDPGTADGERLVANQYGIFFLKEQPYGIVPFSSHRIFLALREGRVARPGEGNDLIAFIREELLYSLSGAASKGRADAVRDLGTLPSDERTTAVLRNLLKEEDAQLRALAVVALLRANEPIAVTPASDYLTRQDRDPQQADSILLAFRHLTCEGAVEALTALLPAGEVLVRRVAVSALGRIASGKSIPALMGAALNDQDQEVRFGAMQALSRITLKPDSSPRWHDFRDNEARYTEFWKHWWATEGKGEFEGIEQKEPGKSQGRERRDGGAAEKESKKDEKK